MIERLFSDTYARSLTRLDAVREDPPVPENTIQCIWYDRLFREDNLHVHDGRQIAIIAPGWWNRAEGPDFQGAQLEFNGRLFTGDVEIHLTHAAWYNHGHHLDPRYNRVLLVVVLEDAYPDPSPVTADGKRIPTLSLLPYLDRDIRELQQQMTTEDYPYGALQASGQCSAVAAEKGPDAIRRLIQLAGEWRMLQKARALRERMELANPGQALYESFLAACGYSHFKYHFRAIARQFHYDRARQLARRDPQLLEAALLQVAGLLPQALPNSQDAIPHFARLRGLRNDHLPGLRPLPLTWRRYGVRPNNNPERRIAGAAMFLSRTARDGLSETLEQIWLDDLTTEKRLSAFEGLFPKYLGFWATHCTWTGKQMARPTAPLGLSRIRSVIGNVFIPFALARARQSRNRRLEEAALAFFLAMPPESDNEAVRIMVPRLFGSTKGVRMNFCMQQGMLQIRQDWCETNPSCRNCSVWNYLAPALNAAPTNQ